jgi:ATP synthase F1 complex assembly factor 2
MLLVKKFIKPTIRTSFSIISKRHQSAPSRRGIKRFYDKVEVQAAPEVAPGSDAAWQVLLDGRPIRSPAQSHLRLPTEVLATTVALEWDSIGELIQPHLMPMMTAVSTITDHMPKNRPLYYDELLKYLDTDTICIRVSEREKELHELQNEKWDPLLAWMGDLLDCQLATTEILGKKPQHNEKARTNAATHMKQLNDFELQSLFIFTTVCKSLSIGFALLHGEISVEDGIALARLEEEIQIEQWGMVEGGHDVDRAHIAVQVASARVLLRTLGEH